MRRKAKLLVALIVVAASAGLVLWNTSSTAGSPAMGVSEAKHKAETLQGDSITVRGTVVAGSIVEDGARVVEFVVGDGTEQLRVLFNRTPPDNFGAKEVVVDGTMDVGADGVPLLRADEIKVGCASKY